MWESSDGWLVAWAFHECVLNRCSTLWLLRFAFFVATCDLTGLGVFATRRALRDVDVTRRQESRVHMACELRRLLARTPARLHRQHLCSFRGRRMRRTGRPESSRIVRCQHMKSMACPK